MGEDSSGILWGVRVEGVAAMERRLLDGCGCGLDVNVVFWVRTESSEDKQAITNEHALLLSIAVSHAVRQGTKSNYSRMRAHRTHASVIDLKEEEAAVWSVDCMESAHFLRMERVHRHR